MKPYYEADGITIYHGDCREVMPELSKVHLILTDPPYTFGIASSHQEGKAGGWGDLMNSAEFFAGILKRSRTLLCGDGAVWMFGSWRSFPVLARAAYEARWPIESLLIWDKCWIGPGGMRGLRPSYEVVALFVEGDYAVANRSTSDIVRIKWSSARPNGHPAEKPPDLMAWIIRRTDGAGLSVLDPFMGSGTTLVAAKNLGRKAIGIEIEERYCEIAAQRLAQTVMDFGPGRTAPQPDVFDRESTPTKGGEA